MPRLADKLAFSFVRATTISRCPSLISRSSLFGTWAWKRAGLKRAGQSRSTYATQSERSISSSLDSPQSLPRADEQIPAIHVNSIEEFEQLVEQGKANISTARSYLLRSRERLNGLPHETQRKEAAKVGAGRLLSWLWKYRDESTRQNDLDLQFTSELCWHLTAEGKDNFIWEWLKIETAKSKWWYGRLLSGLVAARIHWDNSADGAIALFLSAGRDMHNKIHLVQAYNNITGALMNDDVKQPPLLCSPASFNQVVIAAKFSNVGCYIEQVRALLALFHPTEADGTPMLRYCQQEKPCPGDLTREQNRELAQKRWAYSMGRASCILRLRGQKDDAEWLVAKIKSKYSQSIVIVKPWFLAWVYKRASRDPRLKDLFDSSPYANAIFDYIKANSRRSPLVRRVSGSRLKH